ncbi:MAG: DUF2889 domain-containing protein, partial [Burkholderiaceae bacterium]|nr:DUF2889 domain-containing protein [Burkholderiaceae bacterium]
MPLPESPHRRTLKHRRNIEIEFYLRDDDLWDIDANFVDMKPFDLELASSV